MSATTRSDLAPATNSIWAISGGKEVALPIPKPNSRMPSRISGDAMARRPG